MGRPLARGHSSGETERAKSRFLRYTCNGKQRTLEFDEERALMAETQKATVVFGVLNETSQDETRVALTPDIVTRLKKAGVSCLVQSLSLIHI